MNATRTRTTLATAGLLAVLAAGSATALPVAGGSGGRALGREISGGVVAGSRGFATLPPKAGLPGILRTIGSFVVTTDSVVATATLKYNGAPTSVTVRWGDNTTSSRTLNTVAAPIGEVQDPPGTVVFQHVYNAPANGSAFAAAIVAQADNDTETRAVIVSPRFRVVQEQSFFFPRNHCDSGAEEYSEWRIQQTLNVNGANGPTKTWRQDRKTWIGLFGAQLGNGLSDSQPEALADSAVTMDLTMADQHPIATYKVTEIDPVFDDEAGTRRMDLHPSLGTHSVDLDFNDDSDCKATVTANIYVSLLRPGLLPTDPGPVLSAS